MKLNPNDALSANNLAWLLSESGGSIDEALRYAQQSKEKASGNPIYADTLGWIYLKKNSVALAVGEFQSAMTNAPKNQEFQYHLGLAQWRSGKLKEADGPLARVHLKRVIARQYRLSNWAPWSLLN